MLPNKPYSILALSLAIVLALSACHREVKPAPEFKRSEYNKIVISKRGRTEYARPAKKLGYGGGRDYPQMMDGVGQYGMPKGKTIPALALKWEPSDEGRRLDVPPARCKLEQRRPDYRRRFRLQLPPPRRSCNRRA